MKKLTLGAKAMKAGLEKGLSGDDLDIYADIFVYSFRSAALVEFLFGELSLDAVTARAEMSEEEFRQFAREHGADSLLVQTLLGGIGEQQGELCQ